MQEGILSAGENEFPVNGRVTIGRTPDNTISFPGDEKISRNHAYIEQREDGFYYIVDLGSSNGSKLNGVGFSGEHLLQNGDYAILGSTSVVVFTLRETEQIEEEAEGSAEEVETAPEPTPEEKKKNRTMLVGAGGALVLAMAIGGGAIYMASGSTCAATAKIINPEPGDTITEATDIEVEVEHSGCVAKAIFTIDGTEFATSLSEPFEATIDPKDDPDLADGSFHRLGVVLVDKYGERIHEPNPIELAFETRKVTPPTNTTVAQGNTNTAPTTGKAVSLVEIQQMSTQLAKQISPTTAYNVSNRQFLQEVQKRAAEYAQDGNFDRAAQYRDAINVAFVREQNLPAPLGYYLALSRSKFNPAKQGSDEGLFRMTNEFVTANAYNGQCGTETLSDPTQNCAAKAAALYMKAIVLGVFEGDAVYSAVAFGKSPADAGTWKASLPANRADVWNVVKTPEDRDRLVRFFAAGIVAENPQKFGLKDRPIAELYKLAM